jgi:hypothetical protein
MNSWLRARSFVFAGMCAALLFGCAQTPPPSPTAAPDDTIKPTGHSAPPVVVKEPEAAPVASPAPAPVAAAPQSSYSSNARSVATTAALTPSGQPRYACEVGSAKSRIELPTGTDRICSRFPAMGPCQYERDACRAKGGRVIRFDGVEITKEVENEYDKQVQRFKLNAG